MASDRSRQNVLVNALLQGSGFRVEVIYFQGVGLRFYKFMVYGLWFRVQGAGFGVQSLGCKM